jgi:3-oxoacyl-[acyl-carrier protein] reductase
VLATAADFRDPSTAEAWCARTVERFGGVDLLFANSGGPRPGGFDSVDAAAWRDAFDLLLLGIVRVVRAVTPAMRAGGGGAILVSTSSSVKEPLAQLVLSNVMRPAVAALAKTLALELADSGIRVNYIVPGRIETDRLTELDAFAADRSGESPTDLRESMQRESRCNATARRKSSAGRPRSSCPTRRPTSPAPPYRWTAAGYAASSSRLLKNEARAVDCG